MTTLEMDYNSQKEDIVISEYGRNIQNMINHAKTIVDKDERQAFVERVADLINQLFPQSKNVDDYREKTWKHLLRIAKFELDVAPPEGVDMELVSQPKKPEIIPYPSRAPKYRHYGLHVQQLIEKAKEMEEGPLKEEFVRIIASYMKTAYRTWNKEHFVSDEVIKDDLKMMSDGKLAVHEDVALNDYPVSNTPANIKRKRRGQQGGQHGGQQPRKGHHRNKRR
jgi:hypothetical protein